MRKTRIVILAGTGPGEMSLVSPEVIDWLRQADTVVYDRLACEQLLEQCPEKTKFIFVGKTPGQHSTPQKKINEILVNEGSQSNVVIRLKGGDPFIFGRGGEEALELARNNIPYRIIPAITAAVAAGASAGIPLTHRRLASTVTFITGHEDPQKDESAIDYTALAKLDTLVFYMGVGNLQSICEKLIEAGKPADTPTAIVENATRPFERITRATLQTLTSSAKDNNVKAPAIIIIGQVAQLHDQLAWKQKLPLFGQAVAVTRPLHQSEKITRLLKNEGASVIPLPTIEIHDIDNFDLVDDAIERMGEFDWIVFTSPNGVRCFVKRCKQLLKDSRIFKDTKIAAMGPGTAAQLQKHFLMADIIPEHYTSEILAEAIIKKGIENKRILLARTDIAPQNLPETLKQAGAIVEEITIYHTRTPENLPEKAEQLIKEKKIDWVTFTSSSTVTNFLKLTEKLDTSSIKFACIGPVTSQTLQQAGHQPTLIADPHTIDNLVDRIVSSKFEVRSS